MALSPRQIAAYLEFSDRLDGIARATRLADTVVGTRGDQKTVDRLMKQLTNHGRV